MKLEWELAFHICVLGKSQLFNASKSLSEFHFLCIGPHARLDQS